MRELSLGIVKPFEALRVWVQELSVGLINGAALGLLLGFAAWLWKGNIYLGLVVGTALAANTLLAVSIGGTVPLILKRIGRPRRRVRPNPYHHYGHVRFLLGAEHCYPDVAEACGYVSLFRYRGGALSAAVYNPCTPGYGVTAKRRSECT